MQGKTFDVYNQENQAVTDAYAMLAANIHLQHGNRKVKTIVITSCKPGVGKTSISINLSLSMAQSGWKVLLVDSDMRTPLLAKRLNIGILYGLADYLKGDVEMEEILCKTNIPNLSYISCGESSGANPIGYFCSSRFEEFMNLSKESYDFVIFDTPALASVADASLIAAKADGTLLVVELGLTTKVSMKPAIGQLEKVDARIIGAIFNKVKKNDYKAHFGAYNYFNSKRDLNNKNMQNKIILEEYSKCLK